MQIGGFLSSLWRGNWWGRGWVAKAHPPYRLSAGPASPCSSSCHPDRWRAYCKQNQRKYRVWKTPAPQPRLRKAPNDDEHAWNPKHFATVASIQENKKWVQILGKGRKEPKKGMHLEAKERGFLGVGRAQSIFPPNKDGLINRLVAAVFGFWCQLWSNAAIKYFLSQRPAPRSLLNLWACPSP